MRKPSESILAPGPIGKPVVPVCPASGILLRTYQSAGLEVIVMPHKSVDDEHVKRDDDNRQHRRYRDIKEPPDEPHGSEKDARSPPKRSAPYNAEPRVQCDSADEQVDHTPDEQNRDEQLDIEAA